MCVFFGFFCCCLGFFKNFFLLKIKMVDLWLQIEGTKLIFVMNISVLDFFKFASRMPQIAQILVSTFKIFRGSMPLDPPRNFLFFFFHEQFQALIESLWLNNMCVTIALFTVVVVLLEWCTNVWFSHKVSKTSNIHLFSSEQVKQWEYDEVIIIIMLPRNLKLLVLYRSVSCPLNQR